MTKKSGRVEALFTTDPWLTIITGHYGVGKTNLSLNIVRDLRSSFERVTLVDLDIVNPYFRSTDSKEFLDALSIKVFGPVYARTTLDTPSLAPGIDEAITDASPTHAVLIDVGGDPDGARALGRYADKIAARTHRLVYVMNTRRPDMATMKENLKLLREIENTASLKVTHIIGNTHLKEFTSAADIVAALEPTLELAQELGVPLQAITAPHFLVGEVESLLNGAALFAGEQIAVYPVRALVATPWEQ